MSTPPNTKRMRLEPSPETPLANICKKLEISPPKYLNPETLDRTELMTLEAIETDVAQEGFAGDYNEHQAELIFLYGRKFYHAQAPQMRKETIRAILSSATATERILKIAAKDGDVDLLLEKENGEQSVERSQHVASPVEGAPMMTTSTEKNPYNLWIGSVEDWGQLDGAMTIISEFDVKLVLRQQLCSNCFIHAPGVLQGYLVQQGTKSFKGMIDLTKFIRDCVEDDLLASLLLTNNGGLSVDILEALLPGGSEFVSHRLRDPNKSTDQEKDAEFKKILEKFRNHGPALISECKLDQHFREFKQVEGIKEDAFAKYQIASFDEYVPTSKKGTHAMVLVGYRENDCDCTFLLQNWWSEMQFCEVSLDYLRKSNAKVTFCCTEQERFGIGQQISHLKFAEAKFQDRADGYHRELENQANNAAAM